MKKKVVVIDPGHGGKDPGAVLGTRHEADDSLRLGKRLKEILSAKGITVLMTRKTDVLPFDSGTYNYINDDLVGRVQFTNDNHADLFVSLHRNSHNTASANGTEIWVHPNAPETDTTLAVSVLERLVKVGVQANRGVKKGNYIVLQCHAPAILVELGFITNKEDNRLFDSKFEDYTQAMAKGICSYLGIPFENKEEIPQYRVQIGAFTNEENARNFLEQVKGQGLQAFLVAPSSERVEKE